MRRKSSGIQRRARYRSPCQCVSHVHAQRCLCVGGNTWPVCGSNHLDVQLLFVLLGPACLLMLPDQEPVAPVNSRSSRMQSTGRSCFGEARRHRHTRAAHWHARSFDVEGIEKSFESVVCGTTPFNSVLQAFKVAASRRREPNEWQMCLSTPLFWQRISACSSNEYHFCKPDLLERPCNNRACSTWVM